jgi:hypothetical protein
MIRIISNGIHRGVSSLAAVVVLLCAAALAPLGARDKDGTQLVAVAPAEGTELLYDIPLPSELIRDVIELRTGFLDGLRAEVLAIVDARVKAQLAGLGPAAEEFAAAAGGIEAAVVSIGHADAGFGIPGASRLSSAEGSVPDTLFGFTLWHQPPADEGLRIAAELEFAVDAIVAAGQDARRVAVEVAGAVVAIEEAADRGDHAGLEIASDGFVHAAGELREIREGAADAAAMLREIVAEIRVEGDEQLDDIWEVVDAGARDALGLSAVVGQPATDLETAGRLLHEPIHAIAGISGTVAALGDSADAGTGMHHMPWQLFMDDLHEVFDLRQLVVEDTLAGYPDDTRENVERLLGKIVKADRLVAEHAVGHTSREVRLVAERFREHYKGVAGYDDDAADEARATALQKVDLMMKGNMDLQTALVGLKAAEAVLEDAVACDEQGPPLEPKAIIQFKNAWVHCLSAGGSAVYALRSSPLGQDEAGGSP